MLIIKCLHIKISIDKFIILWYAANRFKEEYMNCCEILRIDGIVTHETGCSNQGTTPKKSIAKHYIAIKKTTRERIYIKTTLEPSQHYFPEYSAFIGPFKTKRAAIWGVNNQYNWSCVSEAEELCKGK